MSLRLRAPEPLSTAQYIDDFDCGEAVLDEWLKRRGMAHQLAGAGRTFVAADRASRVYGYYAMAAGAVARQAATGGDRHSSAQHA